MWTSSVFVSSKWVPELADYPGSEGRPGFVVLRIGEDSGGYSGLAVHFGETGGEVDGLDLLEAFVRAVRVEIAKARQARAEAAFEAAYVDDSERFDDEGVYQGPVSL